MLKSMFIAMLLVSGGPAFADEVIIHRDAPVDVVEPPPPPPPVVIERREPDCQTTRTHTEDEDTGDSTTVTRRRCD